MITVGVDLAVDLKDTGLCRLEWSAAGVTATFPKQPADDDGLIDFIAQEGDVVGIDVPLGWPRDFASAVSAYTASPTEAWTEGSTTFAGSYYRLRDTDLAAKEYGEAHGVKINPISVSADKLGATAMRAAWLLTRLARERSVEIDRAGLGGRVVEVYPAGAIRLWGLELPRYKNLRKHDLPEALSTCVGMLTARAGYGGCWPGEDQDRAPIRCPGLRTRRPSGAPGPHPDPEPCTASGGQRRRLAAPARARLAGPTHLRLCRRCQELTSGAYQPASGGRPAP